MMNDPLVKKTAGLFLIVAICFLLLNIGIVFLLPKVAVQDWYWNYVFLIPISVLGMTIIARRYTKSQKITSIGKNYIAYTALKMLLAIVFLIPWLLNKDENSKPMVIHFFIVFFPFLLVETILLVRLLNTPLDEKVKNEQNQDE